jgi:diphthine-ammonia ligase
MKFVALFSGGKDSIYSILESIRNGHELVACVHLGAPDESSTEEESYMWQTAASEVVRTQVEDCLGVPLLLYQRKGTSVNTSLVYEDNSKADEVEDLYLALQQAQEQFGVQAVSSGAILSTYQRVRIEHVCSRLGLTSLSYLWRLLPQKELLQKMLGDGIEAVVVRAACPPGLVPRKHLNKTLRFLWDTGLLERLHERYQFHVCGEGGEYESLVIDSPLHKKKLVFDEVVIEETDDGVGNLRIHKCHAEEKGADDITILEQPIYIEKKDEPATINIESCQPMVNTPTVVCLPHMRTGSGGLLHVSELMASIAASDPEGMETEADLAVHEAREVLSILEKALRAQGATPQDVMFVHLYLSEMSHFAAINAHYQQFFGTLLPPSRSCVAVGPGVLPGGRRVLLDCMIQIGSGEYMRSTTDSPYALAAQDTHTSKLREVLHVQSISHWAPVCVGPYSQVNTLRSGLHFLAGQIGLVPCTMQLHPTWKLQLEQSWKNVASVLDALGGGSLKHLFSGMIYVSHDVYRETKAMDTIESISKKQIRDNGSIIPGRIDSVVDQSELYGGYEDEGTWEEMKREQQDEEEQSSCPILVVSIPEMPKGAIVEVEVVAATEAAASCLEINDVELCRRCTTNVEERPSLGWDTGHGFPSTQQNFNENVQIHSSVRVIGHKCAATALIAAFANTATDTLDLQVDHLLRDMLLSLNKVLAEGRSGLGASNGIHIRLFYTATTYSAAGNVVAKDDGLQLRSALQSAVAAWGKDEVSLPATTLVPVQAMKIINSSSLPRDAVPVLTMQVLLMDPVHTETEIWIHKDRQYAT